MNSANLPKIRGKSFLVLAHRLPIIATNEFTLNGVKTYPCCLQDCHWLSLAVDHGLHPPSMYTIQKY